MKEWTIKQLKEKLFLDLARCNTQLERDCCRAIAGAEIREKAIEWSRARALTPAEIAIAQEFGYRH